MPSCPMPPTGLPLCRTRDRMRCINFGLMPRRASLPGTIRSRPNRPEIEPRHLAFHPKLPIMYCDDEKGDSVTAYTFDRATGQLKAFHTASTLPADLMAAKTPAQILRFRMTARLCTPPTVATTPLPVSPSIPRPANSAALVSLPPAKFRAPST